MRPGGACGRLISVKLPTVGSLIGENQAVPLGSLAEARSQPWHKMSWLMQWYSLLAKSNERRVATGGVCLDILPVKDGDSSVEDAMSRTGNTECSLISPVQQATTGGPKPNTFEHDAGFTSWSSEENRIP